MCGIAGILNLADNNKITRDELGNMVSVLRHRGPDHVGFYQEDKIGFAHSRLSIIDLDSGDQPITDSVTGCTIIFNGEIFNYIELRDDLKKDGVTFRTSTDTEVILQLYIKYGNAFAGYLNGQFAIAIWDKRNKTLVLARDRVGITPLFYHKNNNKLIFASEIKSILSSGHVAAKINLSSLDQVLTFWTAAGVNTMFEGIQEVAPGELMTVKNGQVDKVNYWTWSYPDISESETYLEGTEQELANELHEKIVDATKIRLRSDVPVAAYLSGGLDSSALVSIIHNYGNVPLRTFSIGFDDNNLDESTFQKKLIEKLETKHSNIKCSYTDISESFEKTIWHAESTILRSAPTPMMLLSQLVHDNDYKVVLTGEGADEVLGGYDIFKEAKIRRFWSVNTSSSFRPLLLKRLYPYLDITKANSRAYLEAFFGIGIDNPNIPYFSHLPRWMTTSKAKVFYSKELVSELKENSIDILESTLPFDINNWEAFNKSQYIEARLLMPKYLLSSQGDRMLMANSVEGRFPYLDHNVIEFANRLKPSLKMKVLNEKYLLKKAVSQYLPKEIINRHKQPYRAPDIPSFINNQTSEYVRYMLSPEKIREYGYFDPKKIEIFMKKVNAGRATGYSDNMSFMAVLSTQILHNQFIDDFECTKRKFYQH